MYDAFISYSHIKDARIASGLQTVMQTLGKAWWQRRKLRIFRDETSLTVSDELWPELENKLRSSRFLVLLASPESAKSKWVNKEVQTWFDLHGPEDGPRTLFIALTGGQLDWNEEFGDFTSSESVPLPPALKGRFMQEPLWVDLRVFRSEAEKASKQNQDFVARAGKIAARILGVPLEDLLSEELRQQRRNLRLAIGGITILVLLALTASGLGLVALKQSRIARDQTILAQKGEREAAGQRDNALTTGSRLLAALAGQQTKDGDAVTGALLALEGLPDLPEAPRPFVREAEIELAEALSKPREIAVFAVSEETWVTLESASLSPDGNRIAIGTDNGLVRIWDANRVTPLNIVMKGHIGPVKTASFSGDGNRIVTAGDRTARVWNSATGEAIAVLRGHSAPVMAASFSPDGMFVVTTSLDRTVRIWEASTGKALFVLPHDDQVNSARFSPDGTQIVTAVEDRTARVWNTRTGELAAILKKHVYPVRYAEFSPDGSRIATASDDGTVWIWDSKSAAPLFGLFGHEGSVRSAVFSRDGGRIVTASFDNSVRVWDVASQKAITVLRQHLRGATEYLWSATFSPDGNRIITAADDHTVRIWDLGNNEPLVATLKENEWSGAAHFSPNHALVVIASGASARVWEAKTGKLIATLDDPSGHAIAASFSARGTHLAVVSGDRTVRVWDLASRAIVAALKHKGDVRLAAFSRDGTRVITVSEDKTVSVWEATAGELLLALTGHTDSVYSASFSPDDTQIVTASADGTARLWDATSGEAISILKGHGDAVWGNSVWSARFSPDGTQIVTASWDRTARLWDARTGAQLAVLKHGSEAVSSAEFSADGRRVVTASLDGTVRLWELGPAEPIGVVLTGYVDRLKSNVVGVDLSPEGVLVVTSSGNHNPVVRIWRAFPATQAFAGYAKTVLPRCLGSDQRKAFYLEPQPPLWCIDKKKWPYNAAKWTRWLTDIRAGIHLPLPD